MPVKSKRSTPDTPPAKVTAVAKSPQRPRQRPSATKANATLSPWGTSSERASLRASKREAVLRVAAQIFNEKGFHSTSLDEVAERLHVTKPTLYYYVKNKDEILFECVNIGLKLLEEAVDQERTGGGRAIDQLKAAMRRYVEIVTQDFGACLIRVGEDPLPPDSQRELRKFKAKLDHRFRDLVRQGIQEGSIVDCDPKIAAFTLAGALSWIGRWYRADGPLQPQEIANQCITLLTHGLVRGDERGAPRLRR